MTINHAVYKIQWLEALPEPIPAPAHIQCQAGEATGPICKEPKEADSAQRKGYYPFAQALAARSLVRLAIQGGDPR